MKKNSRIIIPADLAPWPHELCVAHVLAMAGHVVEFLPPTSIKRADIKLDNTDFEIKSPLRITLKRLSAILNDL